MGHGNQIPLKRQKNAIKLLGKLLVVVADSLLVAVLFVVLTFIEQKYFSGKSHNVTMDKWEQRDCCLKMISSEIYTSVHSMFISMMDISCLLSIISGDLFTAIKYFICHLQKCCEQLQMKQFKEFLIFVWRVS